MCQAGRALVVQEMRQKITYAPEPGQPESEAWASERRDGHDTLRWIARQSWCDGNVGSWGPSALGITQNLFAVDAPSVLRAQYVAFAASDLYAQVAYQGGAIDRNCCRAGASDMDTSRRRGVSRIILTTRSGKR